MVKKYKMKKIKDIKGQIRTLDTLPIDAKEGPFSTSSTATSLYTYYSGALVIVNGIRMVYDGTSFYNLLSAKDISISEGTWNINIGSVLTAATASYSKIGKQVALSGTFTFATASTDVSITLPYAPDYGGTFIFGNLTFTFTSASTSATVQSSVITANQTFQLNYKTA